MALLTRRYKFSDPIYKANFRVFIGPFARVRQHMRTHGFAKEAEEAKPRAAMALFCEDEHGAHEILLWFPATWSAKKPADVAVLAHEALHAVVYVFEHRRIPRAALGEEGANYLLEWLVHQVLLRVGRSKGQG